MSMETRAQVDRYLTEVDAALAARGVADRHDIVDGLREHISDASSAGDGRSQAEVLRELGDPQLIAEAAAGQDVSTDRLQSTPARTRAASQPWFSVLALAMVFFGPLLAAILGQLMLLAVVLVGLALMWMSPAWTPTEKLTGTLLVPAPSIAVWVVLGFVIAGEECSTTSSGIDVQTVCTGGGGSPVAGIAATIVLVIVVLAGITAALRLLRSATDR